MLSTKQLIKANNRNYGIDLLRIVSMYMVLILHILGHGRIIKSVEPLSHQYISAWFLEICAFCAVNCYGLISGYVGINSKPRYTNIVLLWFQVVLINVLSTIIFFITSPEQVSILNLLYSFFPVYKSEYWYFSSYFGLFIFLPLINVSIQKLNQKQAKFICLSILLLFSIFPTFSLTDPFKLDNGYSTLWLILLYILGACIRKFDLLSHISTFVHILIYVSCVMLSLVVKLLMDINPCPIIRNFIEDRSLIQYSSPTILLCGIVLLTVFSRMKICSKRFIAIINLLAPVSFGVYIIHEQTYVSSALYKLGIWSKISQMHSVLLIGSVLTIAAVLFVIFSLIDMLRLFLFRRLNIKERIAALENKYLANIWSTFQSDTD